jgi:radical SAM superfamily enzyme YgiQ (UPF0313 family)
LKSVQRILDEIRTVLKLGFHDIYFTDSVFSHPPGHAKSICQALIREKLNIRWMAQVNAAECNEELFKLFKQSGCIGVDLTIDSFSDRMLRCLGRDFTRADIEHAIGWLRKFELPYAVYLVLGGPDEDHSTSDETLSFVTTLSDACAVFLNYGLRIYPGTALEKIAKQRGQFDPDLHFAAPQYFASSVLDEGITERIDHLRWSLPNLSTPTDWNSRIARQGLRVYKKVFNGKPYWKHSYLVGRVRKMEHSWVKLKRTLA